MRQDRNLTFQLKVTLKNLLNIITNDIPIIVFTNKYSKETLIGKYRKEDIPKQIINSNIKKMYISNTGELNIILEEKGGC